MHISWLCWIFIINFVYVYAQADDWDDLDKTTVETILVETTTELVTIITDIPREDVDEALNHYDGRFTTMKFSYINDQYSYLNKSERCFDDYTRCLITQGVATPVCAVNDPYEVPEGYVTFNSYCDVYYNNCKREIRFWRILNNGNCSMTKYLDNILPTRQRGSYFKRIFKYFK